MPHTLPHASDEIHQVIDRFWAVFPSVWHQVRAHIHQAALERSDITVSQFHLLRQIHGGEGSVSALAAAGHISPPAISRMVEVLVNKNLVSRSPNPEDRRQVQLTLTEEGEALLRTIFDNTHQWMSAKLVQLETDELETIVLGIEALKKAFEE